MTARNSACGAGVELKRRPVKRIVESAAVKQRKLGCTQSRVRTGPLIQFVIEPIHQLFRRGVGYLPETGDYVVGSGSQESAGESHQALSRIGTCPGAITSRDRYQVGVQPVLNNIASIQLERGGFDRAFGKHN